MLLAAVAICAAALFVAAAPKITIGHYSAMPHAGILPDVLVKDSRRYKGFAGFFSRALALSPDGRLVLTAGKAGEVVLWDVSRGETLRVLQGHTDSVLGLAFAPDGKSAVSTGLDGKLRWWSVPDGRSLRVVDGGAEFYCLALSPDGRVILTGARTGVVKLWSFSDGALLRTLASGDDRPVIAAQFTRDGRRALTAAMGNTIVTWDLQSGKALKTFQEPERVARGSFISPGQKGFLAGGATLKLLDLETDAVLRVFPTGMPTEEPASAVAFSDDGKFFVNDNDNYELVLWETATGRRLRSFALADHALGVSFTRDGRELIAAIGSDFNVGAVVQWALDAPVDPAKHRSVPYLPSIPAEPARSKAAAALGRLLFFDGRLSRDGSVSCATCHDPRRGWTDGRPVAIGIEQRRGRRNTMTILNASTHTPLLWDGRADSLENQARIPLTDPNEMDSSPERAARSIAGVAGYKSIFREAFGDERVTGERILSALSEFERTLVSHDSPYDRFQAGDKSALSEPEKRGLDLFRGKARCFACHRLGGNDASFMNVGLFSENDLGRFEVTKKETDRGAFGVSDLHSLRYTAPYMHDGSLNTLPEVVDFYDRGGGDKPGKSMALAPLHLTLAEKLDLLTFLDSLSGDPHKMERPRLPE